MSSITFQITGLKDALVVFDELALEIGDKKATSKILVPAVRESIRPVLNMAQMSAPMDTGGLRLSLQIEARRPTRKDKRSKYINETDTVIASVTTASGKKLAKMSEGKGLSSAKTKLGKIGGKEKAQDFMGIKSDARAIAQEFGTVHNAAQPYLRPAMEANSQAVANKLGEIIGKKIAQFRAKNTK